jgi:hypothetical protein
MCNGKEIVARALVKYLLVYNRCDHILKHLKFNGGAVLWCQGDFKYFGNNMADTSLGD